jgi:hypothetical protein
VALVPVKGGCIVALALITALFMFGVFTAAQDDGCIEILFGFVM